MAKKRKRITKVKANPNINRVKRHNFTQGNYRIHWRKPIGSDGACTDPRDRQIWLDPKVTDEELLKIALDEAIHSCIWELDNEFVDEMATAIGEFLFKIGFRLQKIH